MVLARSWSWEKKQSRLGGAGLFLHVNKYEFYKKTLGLTESRQIVPSPLAGTIFPYDQSFKKLSLLSY